MTELSAPPIMPSPTLESATAARNRAFENLLPLIQRAAQIAFRRLPAQAREDAVLDVLAYAFVAYARLIERGRADCVFASPLARFGIAQVRSGRRVGVALNVQDVLSGSCQARHRYRVDSLALRDRRTGEWRDVVVEDRRSTPAEIAALRIDLGDWLAGLPRRLRAIAQLLAMGETTSAVARRFRVSAGRISQLRRDLEMRWRQFQGEWELAPAG